MINIEGIRTKFNRFYFRNISNLTNVFLILKVYKILFLIISKLPFVDELNPKYNLTSGENNELTPETEELEEVIVDNTTTIPAKVIMFNDDWHTFEEVIGQLIKALACSTQHAETLAYEAHEKGKAVVFEGELPACLRVSSILEEISLHTQIEY